MSRAYRSLGVLTAVTILAAGLLAQALAAPAGAATDIQLAASALLLLASAGLLIRVMAYLARHRAGPPPHRSRPSAMGPQRAPTRRQSSAQTPARRVSTP